MIQSFDDRSQVVAKSDKVDHILVLIQLADHLRFDAVVVSVKALANVTSKSDEVCCTENELLFLEQNALNFLRAHLGSQ